MAVALAHTTNIPIRQDHNEVIRILASLYPKTFFAEPKQRRPLKLNIVADLSKADDAELADYNVGTAIDWYISHIGYDHSCIAGAKRLNLDGKEVSRVTESEARDALTRVITKRARIREQHNGNDTHVFQVAQSLYGHGGMTDCQMKKIPAPAQAAPMTKAKTAGAAPSPVANSEGVMDEINGIDRKLNDAILALTKARELLAVDNAALRTALLKSALGVASAAIHDAEQEVAPFE